MSECSYEGNVISKCMPVARLVDKRAACALKVFECKQKIIWVECGRHALLFLIGVRFKGRRFPHP